MLHAKFQDHRIFVSGEEDFYKVVVVVVYLFKALYAANHLNALSSLL